jgi:hypothetical protein
VRLPWKEAAWYRSRASFAKVGSKRLCCPSQLHSAPVAKLPEVQALHAKYVDRGLAVVGIHALQDSDTCAAFLEEQGYSFPVALDSGKTAEAFAISGLPTYFLIDRSGKVVQSFSHQPPSEEAVEALLNGGER